MKEWSLPADQTDRRGRDGIVLVGLGSGAEAGPGALPPLDRVTRRLADVLGRPVLQLEAEAGPDAAQAALGEQALASGEGWLAGLVPDVGLPLADGRCWAEALGDWRQPALLVIPAAQLSSGLPAAATALLRQCQVPLVGLLQWGGGWQSEARRRDGLPWLGLLAEEGGLDPGLDPDSDAEAFLRAALALRWQQLDRPS